MNKEVILELKDLSHIYVNDAGAALAVDHVNLVVHKGEFISLVGPSGCGKTTILNIIAGLIKPTYGELKVMGENILSPNPKLGYMQQQDYLFPWLSIQRNAMIGLDIRKQRTKELVEKTEQLLFELGLEDTAHKYPHQLSGGMRQRVALARTLITEPEILLLDEPFSALDLHIKMQLEELVQSTLDRMGKTAVLVTHDLAEAVAISDRIVVLGRNPGHIRKIVTIPRDMRAAGPIEARKHPKYQSYFDEIWNELDEEMDRGGND
ncbi:MAG: ABC transporter ATP-binding protein [Candidatus Pristimantibacillus lignocellulolyticus]|uniref:ABC transporter ATP-binding protein n=1 Tax=Candidatus Pristimantibacillus lignocellulolyticus TaxID=2994561 RepID=A0A9J6ZD11_9BACL|nr:MAG: ABC transporter ATP-binding protein [Candidatus Pristimantibacillus lignocellulolyticus]